MAERAAKNIQELNAFVRNMGCLMSLMCLISVWNGWNGWSCWWCCHRFKAKLPTVRIQEMLRVAKTRNIGRQHGDRKYALFNIQTHTVIWYIQYIYILYIYTVYIYIYCVYIYTVYIYTVYIYILYIYIEIKYEKKSDTVECWMLLVPVWQSPWPRSDTSLSQRRATTSKAFSKCGTDGRTDFGTEFYFEGFAGKMQK